MSVESSEKVSGKISIADADIVVSAGRGMKGPENWNLIEDLADTLGAATACSKPVSDMGWRPHSEHVGQTGKPVATNFILLLVFLVLFSILQALIPQKLKLLLIVIPKHHSLKLLIMGLLEMPLM